MELGCQVAQRGRDISIAQHTGFDEIHKLVRDLEVKGEAALAVQTKAAQEDFARPLVCGNTRGTIAKSWSCHSPPFHKQTFQSDRNRHSYEHTS